MDNGNTEDQRYTMDALLFYTSAGLMLIWAAAIFIESFGLNIKNHSVTWLSTFLWVASVTLYRGRRHYICWKKQWVSRRRVGEYLAVFVIFYAGSISLLYLLIEKIRIPEQLEVGVELAPISGSKSLIPGQ